MKYGFLGAVAAVALLASGSANAAIIDTFDDTQTISGVSPGSPFTETIAGGTILGGDRTVTVDQVGGSGTVYRVNNPGQLGTMVIDGDAGNSITTVLYDGTGSGFASTDFTAGGDDGIRIVGLQSDFQIAIQVDVTDSVGGSSQITDPGFFFVGAATNLDLLYSSFTTTAGSGADFTDVTQISFTFTTANGAEDLQIDFFGTSNTVPDITIPEPSALAFLGLGLIGLAGYRRRLNKRS
ncbi:MAG: PEP-CTERM sorting domain-containing protein [Alphaproteobacteria bacterium]|nr:PEP-CTERM sorting domain-containing protein [Alphaproteobacteria bacterium]